MKWYIKERGLSEELSNTAGAKARDDLEAIWEKMGLQELMVTAPQKEREQAGALGKVKYHYIVQKCWRKSLDKAQKGDVIYLQFPVINHTFGLADELRKAKKRGIKVIAFVHDLEYLRHTRRKDLPLSFKIRTKKEELSVLPNFYKIVIHNEHMKKLMKEELKVPVKQMVSLEIFDYLIPDFVCADLDKDKSYYDKSCIIAGNLSRKKATYVYDLPDNVNMQLYGPNYEELHKEKIHYNGSFPPDKLPFVLKGSYGLIWDGDSSKTCNGVWGEYLRYNNPHKTSLYLASGIPVIIWSKAALADFVLENKVGVVVNSLFDIEKVMSNVSEEEYREMKKNAAIISERLRNGYYTQKAMKNCFNKNK